MEQAPKSSVVVDAERQLTRKQVADRLGVSVSAVRRMEGKTLHPELGDDGVWRFDAAELRAVPRPAAKRRTSKREATAVPGVDEGELAAKVLEAFAAGAGIRQIVTRLRVAPAKVRELYAEWHLDLVTGERQRREAEQLRAESKEQRERIAWMRALRDDV